MPTKRAGNHGFVLVLTILLILGVSTIAVGILFNGRMGRMSAVNYKNKIRTFMATDGMVTLLAQELINGNAYKYVDTSRVGSIQGKAWYGVPGPSVADFVAMTRSSSPDQILVSRYLGSNLNKTDYGIKWTGWLIPPLTGAYTFYTRSDDESRFYLSSDAEESHLSSQPICRVEPGWVIKWPTSGQAVSAPVPLEAGHRYYFEYYQKQGGGWDVGEVGWDGPEYFAERPISGQYLSRYKSDPDYSGTANVGNTPVRYRIAPMGLDAYNIRAEAAITRPGAPTDTAYRLPLAQSLSLKGPPIPPPAKMFLRVIHRDFLSKVHPEFDQAGIFQGLRKDMVEPTLTDSTAADAAYFGRTRISKPTRRNPLSTVGATNKDCGLDKWFKDWVFDQYDYEYATRDDCRKTKFTAAGDTYRHAKIFDSLRLDLDPSEGPYTYVYSRMGNINTGDPLTEYRGEPDYFPIDWRGNDPVGASHNFSFCTEMHSTFLHQSGLKFEFTGDDDVWVFINNRLVIDLGGVHSSTNAIVNLDDLTWLDFGKTYPFDFFQCERHESNSTSRIVTNIVKARPQGAPVGNWRRDYGAMN